MLNRFAEAVRRASWVRRAALVALHVLVGTAVVVGVGALLLWLLQRQVVGSGTAASRVRLAELGVAVVILLVFFLLWAWLHPILKLAGQRKRDSFWLACVVVVLLTGFLSTREKPGATTEAVMESLGAFADSLGRPTGYDIVLVLDPSDPGVRRLVRAARERPAALTSSLPGAADRDVRFGLIVVLPPRPEPIWRVLRPLTFNRDAVVRALAGLSIERNAASAAGSYSQAVYDATQAVPETTTPQRARLRQLRASPATAAAYLELLAKTATPGSASGLGWRFDADRSIVLVADRLPARTELDSAFRPWKNVLTGSSLSVLTTTTVSPQLAAWREWTARSGGEVLVPGRFDGVRSALDVAELAAIGSPTSRLQHLAERYRPLLFFDSDERFRVLNVSDFLRERDDGAPRHEVCEHGWWHRNDKCHPLRSARDLRPTDDYIDLGDGPTDERPIRNSGVIYYEVLPDKKRVHLAYWWFFRYNESPVWSRYNCLAGLAMAERTCFDHEGDWEGVTVTLVKKTERPESVTYYGHGWPGFRFTWPDLQKIGSISGKHPHVYVAKDSHASYPATCARTGLKCKQLDFKKYGQRLPDGPHDGAVRWYGNERCHGCVQPLPVDSRGSPVSWNDFPGVWGASECTRIAKMCLKSDGPRTPSEQARTAIPLPGIESSLDVLRGHAGG